MRKRCLGKQMDIRNYQRAVEAGCADSYLSYNTSEIGGEHEVILHSRILSPEETLLRKSTLENLSEEAKEVIRLIFIAPAEITEQFTSKTRNTISKVKLLNYLYRQLKWKRKKINSVEKELKEAVKIF